MRNIPHQIFVANFLHSAFNIFYAFYSNQDISSLVYSSDAFSWNLDYAVYVYNLQWWLCMALETERLQLTGCAHAPPPPPPPVPHSSRV